MDYSTEQTVCCNRTMGKRLLYSLMWSLIIVCALCAAICLSAVLSENADGALQVSWFSVIAAVLFALGAFLAWRRKDMYCVDYDYSLCDGEISVSAVYNSKRRKPVLNLQLSGILAFGSVDSDEYKKLTARGGIAKRKFYANADFPLYFFLYEEKGRRCVALLELDDRMQEAVRRNRRLVTGRWE